MRFQFSLATLLVCVTVLAVVAAFCDASPVEVLAHNESVVIPANLMQQMARAGIPVRYGQSVLVSYPAESRPVKINELGWRLAWAWPLSIVTTVIILHVIRRLKSCRHTEPPGG